MTAEKLNEQQSMLVDKLIASHEAEIKYEKNLSFVNGMFTTAVFLVLVGFGLYASGAISWWIKTPIFGTAKTERVCK